jgi:heterokaryon incompatibility protein (HET)
MTLPFNQEDLRIFSRIPPARFNYWTTDTIKTFAPTTEDDGTISLINALKAAVEDSPRGDALNHTGVRQFPLDGASGKIPLEVGEKLLPPDERYAGPISWLKFRERESMWEQIYTQTVRKKGIRADQNLCRVCQRRKLMRNGSFSGDITISYRCLGTWAQLICRSKCMICRLIVLSLSGGSHPLRLHPYLARVDPELQGTQLIPVALPSGEVCMAIEFALRRIGVLRTVTTHNFREVLRQEFQYAGTSAAAFIGHPKSPFNNEADQIVSINQIRSWIRLCETEHSQTCVMPTSKEDVISDYPIMLIDVGNRCLVRSTTASRYIALSYVWGKAEAPETKKENLAIRLKPGGIPLELPQTIEDAVILAGKLQEKYLWVDALCIVQDEAETKHSNIQNMDRIYSGALATIVGLHGTDANAGLPGVRPATRRPQIIETKHSYRTVLEPDPAWVRYYDRLAKSDRQRHEWFTVCRTVATGLENWNDAMAYLDFPAPDEPDEVINTFEPAGGVDRLPTQDILAIASHPPPLKYALETSTWHHRGWTFQERLLSKRVIYFSSDYVYFQCGKHTKCETGGDIATWSDITTSPESGNATALIRSQTTNPLLHFRLPAPEASIEFLPNEDANRLDDQGIFAKQDFDVFKELVEMYSKKQLSFSADTLNALAGILAVVRERIGGEIVAGCTARYLDLSLLWTAIEPADRRTPIGAGGSLFPSWSWSGWSGSKQYVIMEDGKRTYRSLQHEYAQSEIHAFSLYHHGTLIHVHKASEDMRATEMRNLGTVITPEEETFPRYILYTDSVHHGVAGPDLGPNVLQFWTEAVESGAFSVRELTGPSLTDIDHANIATKQTVTKLFDKENQYCGLLFKTTMKTKRIRKHKRPLEFILISSFGESKDRRSGFQTTDTKLRPFDESKFPWRGAGSGLVNVILIEWYDEIAERLSVARIHKQAWNSANPVKKHIRLA